MASLNRTAGSAVGGEGTGFIYTAGIESSREYLNPSSEPLRPKINLLVSPFIPPAVPVELISHNLGGLIMSCTFGKSRSRPGGSVTITIAADNEKIANAFSMSEPVRSLWNELGADLEDILQPMTLAKLEVDGYNIMTVILRTISRNTTVEPPSDIYILQFEELGQLYNESILTKHVILHGFSKTIKSNHQAILDSLGTLTGLPIDQAIQKLVQAFLASTLVFGKGWPKPYFNLSDGLPLTYRMIARPAPRGALGVQTLIKTAISDTTIFHHAAGQSFWGYLQSLCPEPFMELTTESGGRTIVTGRFSNLIQETTTGAGIAALTDSIKPGALHISVLVPGFNYIVMRSTPYENPVIGFHAYPALSPFLLGVWDLILGGDFITITDRDIVSKELGFSDLQQKTVFSVMHTGGGGSNDAGGMLARPSVAGGPLIPTFPGGVRTYGSRSMERHISATSIAWGGTTQQLLATIQNKTDPLIGALPLSNLLNVWFRNQSKFREGTITTRMIPYAKPGMMLLYLRDVDDRKPLNERQLGTYYIDNVSHSYAVGEPPTSTFSLIRGTPLPMNSRMATKLMAGWEIHPPGTNLVDGEPI